VIVDYDQPRGVVVRGVRDDGPAASARTRPGDVIVAVDRQPVGNVEEMTRALEQHRAGTPTLLLVHRSGGTLYVPIG
jgi:S1-C subfamily serine protease